MTHLHISGPISLILLFLRIKYSSLFLLLFCICTLPLFTAQGQPQPEDVFREYVWLPNMVAESGKFLRVGGRLDYQINADHFPADGRQDGHIPFGHAIDLEWAVRAELILERVQSHEDTKGLAVQINDSEWLPVPDLKGAPSPASDYMFHDYPVVPVPLAYLKPGDGNTFKMKVDTTQRWNWPQNIFYGVLLRVYYEPAKSNLDARVGGLREDGVLEADQALRLETSSPEDVARVDYVGLLRDFNRRGDGIFRQWQYSYHRGAIRNHLGTASAPPFEIAWDTRWAPDQDEEILVAARVTDRAGLVRITPAVGGLRFDREESVELAMPYRQPANWVTRADSFTTYAGVHGKIGYAEAVQLDWRSWSPCYARGVYVNGVKVYDREEPCYDYAEHLIEINDPTFLRPGENTISTGKTPLIDGKMVHGMEVQWPGIMMKVRYRPYENETIRIEEGAYAGRPHFIVHTPSAVYYYDRAGGGLSRLIDKAGNDWIAFWPEPWNTYPASAASAYRGIPNLVYRSDDAGAGHPGFDQMESEILEGNRIRSVSKSGKWQWTWHFMPDHARLEVESIDPNHAYWFLYEGVPGGIYDPNRQYYGVSEGGPYHDTPDHYGGQHRKGAWQWAYFGHEDMDRVLFVAQTPPDNLTDIFSYLGNTEAGVASPGGMVVFGFGREEGAVPLMKEPRTFYIGLHPSAVRDAEAHSRLAERLRALLP